MTDYPIWYCSIFGCAYRTSYSKNIENHLSKAHDWDSSEIAEVVNNFFEAKRSGKSVVCRKSSGDPTFPVSLLEGRRDLSRRSVSVRGGGSG